MVSICNNPRETDELKNFINDLKLRNKSLILDIRTQIRKTSGLDVTSQEYEQVVHSAIDTDMMILFHKFLIDFLEEKSDESEKKDFPGKFDHEVTPYEIKFGLSHKKLDLLPRNAYDSYISRSTWNRDKTQKRIYCNAFDELLKKGNYKSAHFHKKNVAVLCSVTKTKHTACVSINSLKDIDGVNIPIEDMLVWRVSVDKCQCDLFVDTETVVAIFQLASFGKDEDLFSAPFSLSKPLQPLHSENKK